MEEKFRNQYCPERKGVCIRSYRNLYKSLPAFRKKLTGEGAIVLAVCNKPIAAMISVDDENVQDISFVVSRLRTQMGALLIQNQARKDGMDKITLDEINALINRTRPDRNEVSRCPKHKWTFVLNLTYGSTIT